MAQLIDGKLISQQIKDELKEEVAQFKAEGIDICLAVIQVGSDPASSVYVRNKKKACAYIGVESRSYELPEETSEEELIKLVEELNADESVNGILVQLPVPDHIDEDKIIRTISPDKDVDGFHPVSVGRLWIGEKGFLSCTPAGIIQLAEYHAPGNTAAFGLVIRRPILCPPKQHIAVDLAAYPYKEPAPRRAQRHAYAPFCTFAHQCRRKPGIGKANYALQRVQRIAGKLLLIPVRDCVFAVKGQVNILRHGIQRVKQLFHGSTSIALRRYSLTGLSFMSLGIQTSFSEQALQAFDGFTLGVYPRR